jgi:hypothetical protein
MKLIADSNLLPKKNTGTATSLSLFKRVFRKLTGKKLDVLSTENFYKPLGYNKCTIRYIKDRIVQQKLTAISVIRLYRVCS